MDFKSLLIYPPVADFTQPHPAIPYLAGYLRNKGENVVIKDLNIDAYEYVLSKNFLEKCFEITQKKFSVLNEKSFINLEEQREYMSSFKVMGINPGVISDIENIKAGFREKKRFYDFKEYNKNVAYLDQALKTVSSAYFPTCLEAAEYSTSFFLSSDEDIIEQINERFNPFIEFYEKVVIPYLKNETPNLIGLSVTYPTQVLQALSLAHYIRKNFPKIHITGGGAFLSRLALNMRRKKYKTLFKYLDSIVLYEGESALYHLISHLKQDNQEQPFFGENVVCIDRKARNIIFPPEDAYVENLDEIPPPDYDGFPLDKYFSPEIVLPYAPTRGCYWNKCAFCHYGATKQGTAKYREKSINDILGDLELLADKYKVNSFSFSIDVLSPKTAINLAEEMIKRKHAYHWNTDIRFEKHFSAEKCKTLKQGGCQSVAIGLESGSQRILELMNKGFEPQLAGEIVKNLDDAGIAVQIMTFLDFPTETIDEAYETIRFLADNTDRISLFTLGDFELLFGSQVFKNPQDYGLESVYYAEGDDFKNLCMYNEKKPGKTEMETFLIDSAYTEMAENFVYHDFPFAGAVSTNHTILYFINKGKNIFKEFSAERAKQENGSQKRFDKSARPKVNPDIKRIKANFSFRKLNENVIKNADLFKASIRKDKQFDREKLKSILSQHKEPAGNSTSYILMDDMEWAELDSAINNILNLCNGKNTLTDILSSQEVIYRDSISKILNHMFSMNVLTE